MSRRDNVIKHLEMLQGVINRMASNSFLIKGWAVVLTGASFWLLARTGANCNGKYGIMAVVAVFGGLDGYYLRQERLFRALYKDVISRRDTDFSMDTTRMKKKVASWCKTCFKGSGQLIPRWLIYVLLLKLPLKQRFWRKIGKISAPSTIFVFYGIIEVAILFIL